MFISQDFTTNMKYMYTYLQQLMLLLGAPEDFDWSKILGKEMYLSWLSTSMYVPQVCAD